MNHWQKSQWSDPFSPSATGSLIGYCPQSEDNINDEILKAFWVLKKTKQKTN